MPIAAPIAARIVVRIAAPVAAPVAAPTARRGGRWWGLRWRIVSLRCAGLAFAAGSLLLALLLALRLPQVPVLREIGGVDPAVVDTLGPCVRSMCPVERIDALHRSAAEALLAAQVVEVMQRTSVLGRPLAPKASTDGCANGREIGKKWVQRERITIDI